MIPADSVDVVDLPAVPYNDGRKLVRPEALTEAVLSKLRQAAKEHLGQPVRRAVISVPVYFEHQEQAN